MVMEVKRCMNGVLVTTILIKTILKCKRPENLLFIRVQLLY